MIIAVIQSKVTPTAATIIAIAHLGITVVEDSTGSGNTMLAELPENKN